MTILQTGNAAVNNMVIILGWIYLVWVVYWLLTVLFAVWRYWLRPGKDLKKYGQWAIVTGATDGIGKAYAFVLAKHGMNVLLLSRTEAKLQQVEQELKAEYPKVEASHLAVDFGKFDEKAREAVQAKIASLDVGVLVNNVGMNDGNWYFHECSIASDIVEVETNINGTIYMTKLVLGTEQGPGMVSRKRGAIVNTGSMSAQVPAAPLLAMYGSTKKFIEHFSKSLRSELAPFNIDVNCQVPFLVSTKINYFADRDLWTPAPEKYASACVAHIGYEDHCAPYWPHALQIWKVSLVPNQMIIKGSHDSHLAVRKQMMDAGPEAVEQELENRRQALLAKGEKV